MILRVATHTAAARSVRSQQTEVAARTDFTSRKCTPRRAFMNSRLISDSHRIATLARANRKIVRRRASGSCIGKVPPFMIVICKSLFAHGLVEHPSPAALFGADGGTRGVARGIEAVETRAHVDGVVGTALRERGGARPIGGRRVEGRRRRRPS